VADPSSRAVEGKGCSRLIAGIALSNPVESLLVRLLYLLFVLQVAAFGTGLSLV